MKKSRKGILSLIGLILFVLAFLSIILKLIGLRFTPLSPIDQLGVTASFVIKFALLFLGIILMYCDQNKEKWLNELERDEEYIHPASRS